MTFKFQLNFFLLCLFFFVLFCVLGVWQLYRYQEKKLIVTHYQQQTQSAPTDFTENPAPFQQIKLIGHLLSESSILVQNKFYQGKPGYEVITPMRIMNQKKLLLVNRGWIPVAEKNQALKPIRSKQHLIGYVKLLDAREFILGKNILNPQGQPLEIQKIAIDDIASATQQSYFNFIVRLDKNQPHGFVRDWAVVSSIPERHLGYAVQWFALAVVVLVAYGAFSLRRH